VLLLIAAITSGALGGVAESFAVHENARFESVHSQLVDPKAHDSFGRDDSSPGINPVTTATFTGLPQPSSAIPPALRVLRGEPLLARLGSLAPADLSVFVKANPQAIHLLMTNPPLPATVSGWWSGLGVDDRTSFAAAAPALVGNLDGVPFAVRDAANRSYLSTSIARATAAVSAGIGRAQLVGERHRLEILKQIQRTLDANGKETGGTPRQLITFDPTGNGRAAVVVGDLSKADYVSYLVPGMLFTVQGQIFDWTATSQNLYNQQVAWLKVLAKVDHSYQGKTVATVAWIGYSTPGVLDVVSLSRAEQGADLLGSAIQGLHAARSAREPFVTLVTHSYGSTAAMIELARGGVSVDALAIIGSPGSAAKSAKALSVKNGNVYVGEAAWDPVVHTAFYGSDPGSASFGAHPMDVAAGVDPVTGRPLSAAIGHLGYFDTGCQAMRNLALIGLDQGRLVSTGTVADSSRTLAK